MNIAVICLAHMTSSAGVELLADYFRGVADLFIHIDKKSNDAPYVNCIAENKHVQLCNQRYPIFWGGFNTVKACIGGVRQAMQYRDYDRYLYITEDTIPLVRRDIFHDRMSSQTEWIQTKPVDNPEWLGRYSKFFYYDSRATTPRPTLIIDREWHHSDSAAILRMEALRLRGKHPIDRLYSGGTWWALTRDSINKFLLTYETNDHLRESFEFSAIPEEQFVHTILGALDDARPLVFTNFSREPKPYLYRTLNEILSEDTKGATMLRKVAVGAPDIDDFVRTLMR